MYIDFTATALQNYQRIYAFDKDSHAVAFFDLVRPDGTADYKKWLDPSAKGIIYTIKFDNTFYETGNLE